MVKRVAKQRFDIVEYRIPILESYLVGNKVRALEKIMEENDLAEKHGFRIENRMAEQKGQANQNDGITRDLARISEAVR